MWTPLFRDRREAGRRLARELARLEGEDVVVLGLARGGVPVADEVARALEADLDVFVVRKLGVPGHEELALGAIASGGVRVLNDEVVAALGLDAATIDAITAGEVRELARREAAYRSGREPRPVRGRTAILVDDGLATGASVRAAITALRRLGPERIVVAVPVAPAETCEVLRGAADEVVCLATPEPFLGVGAWYDDFSQVGDDEVTRILARARPPGPRGSR